MNPQPPEPVVDAAAAEQALELKLGRAMGRALGDFSMLEEGDRVMVAVSGGKDSYAMLHLLRALQRRAPIRFTLHAINIDQGQPGYPGHLLREYMAREAYDFQMIEEDTYSIVKAKIPEGKTTCSLCSRLRRGILYRVADELGCNKIALGHHRDDIVQTLMLNLLYAGKLSGMPARFVADNGRHTVIRPLAYCAESDLAQFALYKQFPILPCNLCGSQENLQRKVVAQLLEDLERKRPGTKTVMMAALANVEPTQLLDRELLNRLHDAPTSADAELPLRGDVAGNGRRALPIVSAP